MEWCGRECAVLGKKTEARGGPAWGKEAHAGQDTECVEGKNNSRGAKWQARHVLSEHEANKRPERQREREKTHTEETRRDRERNKEMYRVVKGNNRGAKRACRHKRSETDTVVKKETLTKGRLMMLARAQASKAHTHASIFEQRRRVEEIQEGTCS